MQEEKKSNYHIQLTVCKKAKKKKRRCNCFSLLVLGGCEQRGEKAVKYPVRQLFEAIRGEWYEVPLQC